jgi:dimethylamine monooxygenase subunit A
MAPRWLDEIAPATSPPFVRMGIRAMGETTPLFLDGDDVPAQLAEKDRILAAHHDDVVATTPEADAACAELLTLIQSRPDRPDHSGPTPPPQDLDRLHPLEAAARLVAEDLCILQRDDRLGQWVLTAGAVCFPSHWRLRDKLGRPLADIHGPVPDYAQDLADKVDRFFDRLRPGAGVWRRNWTVHTRPDLFAPDPPAGPPDPPITVHNAGTRLWLRSEQQCLNLVAKTRAILFTIRTQQVPLSTLREHPRLAAAIADAVDAWPEHQVAYRGGSAVTDPLVRYLRTISHS